ncbi:MAG: type I secretion system permease/ATPase, partial [Aeromonas sp.]
MLDNNLTGSLLVVCQCLGKPNIASVVLAGLPTKNNMLTEELLVRAAKNAGLLMTHERVFSEHILLPAILPLLDGTYCVVTAINSESKTVTIIRSSTTNEHEEIESERFSGQVKGDVFSFKRDFAFDERAPSTLQIKREHWFWSVIFKSRFLYKNVLLATFFINLFALITPLFTRVVYDKILPNFAFDTLWTISIGLVLVYIFEFIVKSLRGHFIDAAANRSDVILSSRIIAKLLGMRLDHKPISTGGFARNIQEFQYVRDFISSATMTATIDLPFALLFIAVILSISWQLVLVPVVGIVIITVYCLMIQRLLKYYSEQSSRFSMQRYATLIESIIGIETIKAMNAQAIFQSRWEESVSHAAIHASKIKKITDSLSNVSSFVQQSVNMGVIIVGVYLISEGLLTMGDLIAVTMLCGRALGPLIQLSGLSIKYNQAKAALHTVNEIMAAPDENKEDGKFTTKLSIDGNITLDNVSFSYQGNPSYGLKNVSLTIKKGEKIALIGHVGSGKTTLMRLLLGLYTPTEGTISFDGFNASQLHKAVIRDNMGYLPQEPCLFYGSIHENILLSKTMASDADIMMAVEKSGVASFTAADADGIMRQVGEQGQYLSGGQRQCVALARALLGEPAVLLLDEPTSAMDNGMEQFIKSQLVKNSEQTVIISTHRPSLLEVVDRIIVFEKGRIIADGPKSAILA